MGGDGGGEAGEAVAAFEDGDEAALAVLGGGLLEEAGEVGEVVVGEVELAEGVVDARIESGGDHDEIWLEAGDGGEEAILKDGADFFHAGPGGEGEIERGPLPFSGSGFIGTTGEGIPGGLVGAGEEDGGVVVKDVLGAVAVVDVPVHDEDFRCTVFFLGVAGADGDVIEEAEAHALGGAGVVAGGTDGAEGALELAGHDEVHGIEDGADGVGGDGVAFVADLGIAGAEGI